MKIANPFLKVILSFVFSFIFAFNLDAQVASKNPFANIMVPIPGTDAIPLVNCTSIGQIGCNYIHNNTFTPSAAYFNPYISTNYFNPFNYDGLGNSLIPDWDVANGTPTVYDGIALNSPLPPPNTSGYFSGITGYVSTLGGWYSEGVVQKIPTLSPNNTYTLSFYKLFDNYTGHPLDHLKIVLMRCQDYTSTFWPVTYQIPVLPAISQPIYCETSVQNIDWNQVFIKFRPNYAYDMIWIYPEGNHDNQNKFAGIFVSFPELINVSNFNAGPTPTPTSPNCIVTLGPTTPNCGPTGAVFTWTGPPGHPPPVVLSDQQIQVDASIQANVGTWTLSMTMPNAVTTNSNGFCSQQQDATHPVLVSASVDVPLCSGTCTPPNIWASGPLDQCIQYESPFLTFSTNITSNIQWYNNGNIIPGATGQTYTENNNPGPNWPTSTGTYFVKNTLTNCISNTLSVIRRNYSTPNVYPGSLQTTLNYCKNNIGVLHQEYSISDPNAIYRWQILDPNGNDVTGTSVILGANNSTTYHTSISFVNYPFTTATIIAGATDNGCTNTATPYQVTIHPDPCNYFAPTVTIKKEIKYTSDRIKEPNDIIIYPNPTSNQITITSKETISYIEISDLMNPILKRIKVNGAKSTIVNVSDLNPGIYNCKITTGKGTENRKLIIKR